MALIKKRGLYETGRVVFISVREISVNPSKLRRESSIESVRELSESIAKYGVLQPLCIRKLNRGYELVSGERRLRASKLAGLSEVPCIVLDVGEEESAALVLVENLQRRDLDFIEEAQALGRLRELYGYSQEEVARMIGRSQPAVANKLRLLKLPPELLFAVRDSGLTERHARALLRLSSDREMAVALGRMIADDMNVAQAEAYIENLLLPETEELPPSEPEKKPVVEENMPVIKVRDHRVFMNSVERGANIMRRSGIAVKMETTEDENEIVMKVRIPKNNYVING